MATGIRTAKFKLKSSATYSGSRQTFDITRDVAGRETHDMYDERVWPQKMHYKDGRVIIPSTAISTAILDAQQLDGSTIPGKGKSSYAKLFEKAVRVYEPVVTNVPQDQVVCETLSMNADGRRGSGKRVMRRFPVIHQWEGELSVTVLDPSIPEDVVEKAVMLAGSFIGVGRWRPQNRGNNGRFVIEGKPKWETL